MRKKTKVLLWSAIAFSIIILLPLATVLLVADTLLDHKAFPLSNRTPNGKDLESALRKLDTFTKTRQGKKRDWTAVVSEFLTNPEQTVSLNKKEVNALIDAGLVEAHAKAAAEHSDALLADAFFDGKRFHLKVSKNVADDIGGDTPFGHFINISMLCDISVTDNHFHLKVRSLKIGAIPISERWYADGLAKQLADFEKTPDGKKTLSIIRSLKTENNALTLRYDARQLALFLMDKLPNLLQK